MYIYKAKLQQDNLIKKLIEMLNRTLELNNILVDFTAFLLDENHAFQWDLLSSDDISQLSLRFHNIEGLSIQLWDNYIGNNIQSEVDIITDFCVKVNEIVPQEKMESVRSILRSLLYTRIIKLNSLGIGFSYDQIHKIDQSFKVLGINLNISINSSMDFIISKILTKSKIINILNSNQLFPSINGCNYYEKCINKLSQMRLAITEINNNSIKKFFYINILTRINDFSKSSMHFNNLILNDIKYNLLLALKYNEFNREEFVEIFEKLRLSIQHKYGLSVMQSAFFVLDTFEKYFNETQFHHQISNLQKDKVFQYLSFFLEGVIEDSDKISQYEFLKTCYWLSGSFVAYSDEYNSYETHILTLLNKTKCDNKFITDVIENGWLKYYTEFRNWCLMNKISTTFDGLFIDTEALFIQYQQLPLEAVDRRSVIKYAKLFEYDKANIILENLYNHCFAWTMFSEELKDNFADAITFTIKLMSDNQINSLLYLLLGVFDNLDEKGEKFINRIEEELINLELLHIFKHKLSQINYYCRKERFNNLTYFTYSSNLFNTHFKEDEVKDILYASSLTFKNNHLENKITIVADYQQEEKKSHELPANMLNKLDHEKISSSSSSSASRNDVFDRHKDDKKESENNIKRESLEEREPIIVTDYSQEEEKSSESSDHVMLNKFNNQQTFSSSASLDDVFDGHKDDKKESENIKREFLEKREPIIVTDYSQEKENHQNFQKILF